MKKKAILYSIGNRDKYNFYILDKKNETINMLLHSLSKIFGCEFHTREEYKTEEGNWDSREINFEKIIDEHSSDTASESKVDLFYGNKKIFLSINCSSNKRVEFNTELFEFAKMPKLKEKPKDFVCSNKKGVEKVK